MMSDELTHACDDRLDESSGVSLLVYNGVLDDGHGINVAGGGGGAAKPVCHVGGDDAEAAGHHHRNNDVEQGEEDEEDAAALMETFGGFSDLAAAAAPTAGAAGGRGLPPGGCLAGDCGLCQRPLSEPVFLACLHRFDLPCLVANAAADPVLICPRCRTPTVLCPGLGLAGLTRDYLYAREAAPKPEKPRCGGCTTGAEAVARCRECADYLCQACRQAHSVMKTFSRHRVRDLTAVGADTADNVDDDDEDAGASAPLYCAEHPAEQMRFYCHDCASLHCAECVATGHKLHRIEPAASAGRLLAHAMLQDAARLRGCLRRWEAEHAGMQERLSEIEESRQHNEGAIREALASYKAFVEQAAQRLLDENRQLHSELEMRVMEQLEAVSKGADQMAEAAAFVQAYGERAGPLCAAYAAKVLRDWAATLLRAHWDTDLPSAVPFRANHADFRALVMANFGRFTAPPATGRGATHNNGGAPLPSKPAAAAAPAGGVLPLDATAAAVAAVLVSGAAAGDRQAPVYAPKPDPVSSAASGIAYPGANPALFGLPSQPSPGAPGSDSGVSIGSEPLLSSVLASKLQLDAMQQPFDFSLVGAGGGGGGSGAGSVTGGGAPGSVSPQPTIGAGPPGYRAGRCAPMTVRHRWGSLGSASGQFNSPHGFCLGPDEDIVVADTQNHRVQVFDKTGEHKFQFGVAGRDEGQLWYPRKVVVMRQSAKFVVCDRGSERSRMQIFGRTGQFLRKITVRYIDIVAGLAINSQGHIVAVDSVSPTVFVIAENGDLVKWFDCSSYMREPSDIAVQGREYFICDFKGHCVCVFQEDGVFLRRIGSESITNFPNGIDISDHGDILVGDSHGNKFHVAVFNRSGLLTSEFECPSVKVSRCCGLKITSEGFVVTLAKNNHHVLVLNTLYIS